MTFIVDASQFPLTNHRRGHPINSKRPLVGSCDSVFLDSLSPCYQRQFEQRDQTDTFYIGLVAYRPRHV